MSNVRYEGKYLCPLSTKKASHFETGLNVSFNPTEDYQNFGRNNEELRVASDVQPFTSHQASEGQFLNGVLRAKRTGQGTPTVSLLVNLQEYHGSTATISERSLELPEGARAASAQGIQVRFATYQDPGGTLRATSITLNVAKSAQRFANQIHPKDAAKLIGQINNTFLLGGHSRLHGFVDEDKALHRHLPLSDLVQQAPLLHRINLEEVARRIASKFSPEDGRTCKVIILPEGRTHAA